MRSRESLADGEQSVARPPPWVKGESLAAAIAGLGDRDADQLRLQWRNHLGGAASVHLPRWLLLRLLAYRLQAAALGDLDRGTLRLLRQSAREGAATSDVRPFQTRGPATREGVGLKSGTLLVREWNGRLQRVMILEKGFAWNGVTYRSLSHIAKAMTGTNWNGHRFFSLRPASDQSAGAKKNRSLTAERRLDAARAAT